jgi:hypothetical protein
LSSFSISNVYPIEIQLNFKIQCGGAMERTER